MVEEIPSHTFDRTQAYFHFGLESPWYTLYKGQQVRKTMCLCLGMSIRSSCRPLQTYLQCMHSCYSMLQTDSLSMRTYFAQVRYTYCSLTIGQILVMLKEFGNIGTSIQRFPKNTLAGEHLVPIKIV